MTAYLPHLGPAADLHAPPGKGVFMKTNLFSSESSLPLPKLFLVLSGLEGTGQTMKMEVREVGTFYLIGSLASSMSMASI